MLWSEVEPVLRATYGLLADPERLSVDPEEIAAALGRPDDDAAMCSALRDLQKYGYIDGIVAGWSVPCCVDTVICRDRRDATNTKTSKTPTRPSLL